MSDTQDTLSIQRRVQQRQILAMMGINQWVQAQTPTLAIATALSRIDTTANTAQMVAAQDLTTPSDAPASLTDVPISSVPHTAPDQALIADPEVDSNTVTAPVSDASVNSGNEAVHNPSMPAVDDSRTLVSDELSNQLSTTDKSSGEATNKGVDTVAPFDLQGGRYGDWVLIVNIQALNNDSQKLWQNITQALSIECESSSFPICAGMDTAELANASLAGYLFKIGRSDSVNVAALTALPKGLAHPNITDAPTLDAMLADSTLKRQLWEQISS